MQPETQQDTADSPLFVQPDDDWTHPYPPQPDGPGSIPNPQAPYGINPDTGRPYTKSPEERAEFGRRMAEARARRAGQGGGAGRTPPRKAPAARPAGRSRPSSSSRAPRQATPEEFYTQAAAGALTLIPAVLSIAARIFRRDVLALDAVAVGRGIPGMATAVGSIAVTEQRLAQLLDKVAEVGPWGQLTMAAMPVALQLAANHGFLQPSEEMGILSPDDLMATLDDE